MENLPKGQIKITLKISKDEMGKFLDKAAREISKHKNIKGFRPGKATRKAVELEVGKEYLWREAAVLAMPEFVQEVVDKENLKTVGSPEYNIGEVKPDNDLEFDVVLNLVPEVKLPDLDSLKVKDIKAEVKKEHIDKAVDELRRSKATEKLILSPAKKGDRVDISLEVEMGGQVIDKSDKVTVYIGEGRFIPGFEDALVGLSKGESKEFTLKFPKDYPNKELAEKDATFKVKVLEVYEVSLPAKDDKFAQSVSDQFKTVKDLEKYIEEDLKRREEDRLKAQQENEILDIIIKNSTFSDIPEILINSEAKALLREFEFDLLRQGISVDDYLKQIGKSRDDLLLDMAPKAVERVKASLVMSKVVEEYQVSVSEEELNAELDKIEQAYQNDKQMLESLQKSDTKQRVYNIMLYNKTMDMLRDKMVEKKDK